MMDPRWITWRPDPKPTSQAAKAASFLKRLVAANAKKMAELEAAGGGALAASGSGSTAGGSGGDGGGGGGGGGGVGGGGHTAQGRSSRDAKDEARFKCQSSDDLNDQAEAMEQQMKGEERKLDRSLKPFKPILGEALMHQFSTKKQTDELVRGWAPKGEIPLIEFRKHVRKVVEWPHVKDIDTFFREMDDDDGGTLSVSELQNVLQTLREEAKESDKSAEKIRERITFFKRRIERTHEVAELTRLAERADAQLARLRANKSAAALLGAELLRRNAKIADLLTGWAKNKDGDITKKEFRANVWKMGGAGNGLDELKETQLDELFESLDDDGGGSLDTDELKAALVQMREASQETDKEISRLKKATVDLWKSAKAAQLERRRQKKADEAEAAAQREQAAREARAMEEAAARAEAAKAAKLEELRRRKQEEKDAYDEMIAEKRKAMKSAGK